MQTFECKETNFSYEAGNIRRQRTKLHRMDEQVPGSCALLIPNILTYQFLPSCCTYFPFTNLNKALLGAQSSPLKISVTKYDMGIGCFRVGSWIITPFLQATWLKYNESDVGSRSKSYRSPTGLRENDRFSYFFF